MSDKLFLGGNVAELTIGERRKQYTKVILTRATDQWYEAGDETGSILELKSPWATQEMCNSIFAAIKNYQYLPYDATDAIIDPAAEIGDAIQVGGIYSEIANIDLTMDAACLANVSAPGADEVEDEYPYKPKQQREIERENKRIYSLVTKTDEEIRLYVTDEIKGVNSTISQTATSIRSEIQGVDDKYSSLEQTVDGFTFTTAGGVTKIEGSSIDTSTIRAQDITAGNIQGENVKLATTYGDHAGDLKISGADTSSYAIELSSNGALRLKAKEGNAYISSGNGSYINMGYVATYFGGKDIAPERDNAFDCGIESNRWRDVYSAGGVTTTSDRNAKKNIDYDLDKYGKMFDGLKPCAYNLIDGTSGRTHLGLIAQDVEESLQNNGMSTKEFAGVVKSQNDEYALRYHEFIALCIDQIQKLKKRVEELEKEVANGRQTDTRP